VLEECGIASSHSAAARSYAKWGRPLVKPAVGCIVVFERGPRNGHVGFYLGKRGSTHIRVLGGNQGDAVNIKLFPVSRVIAYRWPRNEPLSGAAEEAAEGNEEESFDEAALEETGDLEMSAQAVAYAPTFGGWLKKRWRRFAAGGGAGGIGVGSLFEWNAWTIGAVAALVVIGLAAAWLWWLRKHKR
jgi:hypothetical protein